MMISFAPSPSMPLVFAGVCEIPSRLSSLESAFRSFFIVLATYILAGEVDTTLPRTSFACSCKLSWLVRYYNPVNLCWRYYSMLAFRFSSKRWGDRQLALINFEAYPYRAPIPYIVGERLENFWVRRLEISGLASSQGLLSVISAYQGIMTVQFIVVPRTLGFLPTISKPLAILSLFRVMVSPWIVSKVFVEPYPYPAHDEMKNEYIDSSSCNKFVAFAWAAAWLGILILSFWPYIGYPEFRTGKTGYVDRSMEILYQYNVLSVFLFHIVLLMRGPYALANRILFFDHWLYKLQTSASVLLLFGTVCVGLVDFVANDFYRFCFWH